MDPGGGAGRGPVEVRKASPADAEPVARLLAELGYQSDAAAVGERLAAFAASARDHVLLAEVGGRVVGVLALSLTMRLAEPGMFSRITALAVDPTLQRAGIGRVLVAEAERIAVAAGSSLMQVNSGRRPEREAAHGFYVALGYRDQHDHHVLYDKALHGDGRS